MAGDDAKNVSPPKSVPKSKRQLSPSEIAIHQIYESGLAIERGIRDLYQPPKGSKTSLLLMTLSQVLDDFRLNYFGVKSHFLDQETLTELARVVEHAEEWVIGMLGYYRDREKRNDEAANEGEWDEFFYPQSRGGLAERLKHIVEPLIELLDNPQAPSTALYRLIQLDKPIKNAIVKPQAMPGQEQNIIRAPFDTPARRLWQAIEPVAQQSRRPGGQTPRLNERRQAVLRAYLTTDASQSELRDMAGVSTTTGVNSILHRAMATVYPHLPEEVRQEYGATPEEALRVKSGKHTDDTIEQIRRAKDKYRDPESGKVQFSASHLQNLTQANRDRRQREREEKQK